MSRFGPSTVLVLGLAAPLAVAATACGGEPEELPPGCEGGSCSFCSPDVWGGAVPTASTDVRIPDGMSVVVDCAAEARTITVEGGGLLFASRTASSTLTLHGNLVVYGTVDYGTPDSRIPAGTTAELVFTGMNDDDYAGTPTEWDGEEGSVAVDTEMKVIAGDIGLWVMGSGTLAAAGAEKRAWSKLTEGAGPGDAALAVDDASGWKAGDRVVLTPSAPRSAPAAARLGFHEATLASVDGKKLVLDAVPANTHDGCTDCVRRAEAANLTRNVVIRSADASAHAHVMIAEQGRAKLDSVELRWLGPNRTCGGSYEGVPNPQRRAPLWFHQQGDASADSFVRHVSIWGAGQHFLMLEKSNGVEVKDVAGFDTHGTGVGLFYDNTGCGTRCTDRPKASAGTVLEHVLVAKVGVIAREDCARIEHRLAGVVVSGGEGSGARDTVAVGVGWDGSGEDIAGFGWVESGSGRPADFTFTDNVAHNNLRHGALVWHNTEPDQTPWARNQMWSNGGYGIHWGAYANPFGFTDSVFTDNGLASVGAKAIPNRERPRLANTTVDDITILAYVFLQEKVATFSNITFTGARPVGVTQIHDPCVGGNPNDPADTDCLRVWLRFDNPVFPAGMKPFDFGQTFNKHSVWEIRGFSSPDYPALPANFDLHRADNTVAGGSYYAPFDAWLVPR